jgi:hypothetical protein
MLESQSIFTIQNITKAVEEFAGMSGEEPSLTTHTPPLNVLAKLKNKDNACCYLISYGRNDSRLNSVWLKSDLAT